MILTLGGLAYLYLTPWIAAAVVLLLAVVVLSYRQVVQAYPSGGGSYEVVATNLGPRAGLVVAAALLVDYVMTVAVSVAAGVDNIISAIPDLNPYRVADQYRIPHAVDGDESARRARIRASIRRPDLCLHRRSDGDDRHRPSPHVAR